jgi:hypothetical protein
MQEKKVITAKKYEFLVTHFDDGTTNLERTNDGFNALEILGLTNLISLEVKDIIQGKEIKIETIQRKVVID